MVCLLRCDNLLPRCHGCSVSSHSTHRRLLVSLYLQASHTVYYITRPDYPVVAKDWIFKVIMFIHEEHLDILAQWHIYPRMIWCRYQNKVTQKYERHTCWPWPAISRVTFATKIFSRSGVGWQVRDVGHTDQPGRGDVPHQQLLSAGPPLLPSSISMSTGNTFGHLWF